MFKHDTVHGAWKNCDVKLKNANHVLFGNKEVAIFAIRYDTVPVEFNIYTIYNRIEKQNEKIAKPFSEADEIPWSGPGAEYIVESSVDFTEVEKAGGHLKVGCCCSP